VAEVRFTLVYMAYGEAMMDNSQKKMRRLGRVQLVLAILFAVLTVLAVAVPTWIEEMFDLSPDGGSGELERWFAIPFGVGCLVFGGCTWHSRRRLAANAPN
jgi:hypothetical protein